MGRFIQTAGKAKSMDGDDEASKRVHLQNWYVFIKYDKKRIAAMVRGLRQLEGGALDTDPWQSSLIVRRLSAREVQTRRGTCYVLEGNIDEGAARKASVSEAIINLFTDGFPENWKRALVDLGSVKEEDHLEEHPKDREGSKQEPEFEEIPRVGSTTNSAKKTGRKARRHVVPISIGQPEKHVEALQPENGSDGRKAIEQEEASAPGGETPVHLDGESPVPTKRSSEQPAATGTTHQKGKSRIPSSEVARTKKKPPVPSKLSAGKKRRRSGEDPAPVAAGTSAAFGRQTRRSRGKTPVIEENDSAEDADVVRNLERDLNEIVPDAPESLDSRPEGKLKTTPASEERDAGESSRRKTTDRRAATEPDVVDVEDPASGAATQKFLRGKRRSSARPKAETLSVRNAPKLGGDQATETSTSLKTVPKRARSEPKAAPENSDAENGTHATPTKPGPGDLDQDRSASDASKKPQTGTERADPAPGSRDEGPKGRTGDMDHRVDRSGVQSEAAQANERGKVTSISKSTSEGTSRAKQGRGGRASEVDMLYSRINYSYTPEPANPAPTPRSKRKSTNRSSFSSVDNREVTAEVDAAEELAPGNRGVDSGATAAARRRRGGKSSPSSRTLEPSAALRKSTSKSPGSPTGDDGGRRSHKSHPQKREERGANASNISSETPRGRGETKSLDTTEGSRNSGDNRASARAASKAARSAETDDETRDVQPVEPEEPVAASGIRRSQRGRMIMPVLEFWRNQTVRRGLLGVDGIEEPEPATGPMASLTTHQKRSRDRSVKSEARAEPNHRRSSTTSGGIQAMKRRRRRRVTVD